MFRRRTIDQLRPADVAARRDDIELLDVREPAEWRAGHVPGSRHIPLQQLPNRLAELDVGSSVVVVCRSGSRSDHAARFLAQQGYQAANLAGGLQAWAREGHELVRSDEKLGRVI
jgi:rhodanese-related sulfurtransferase